MTGCFQNGSFHHLINTSQSRTGQHHAGRGKHDLCERSRNNGGKHRIENKVGNKSGKISICQCVRRKEQSYRHQKHKRSFGESQIDRLRYSAHIRLVMLRFIAVIFNGLLKCLKRINCLLKDFYHRNTSHIFRSGLSHTILGRLIFRYQFGIFSAHHGKHCND